MNIRKIAFVKTATRRFGEKRNCASRIYPPIRGFRGVRLPDWVRGLIEEAYDHGVAAGTGKESNRIKKALKY